MYQYAVLGGCTTQLRNRLRLADHGIEPHFIFASEYGGTVVFGDYPHVRSGLTDEEVAGYIGEHNFDVISVLDAPDYLRLLSDIGFKGRTVSEVHTTYPDGLAYLAEEDMLANVDCVLTTTEYQRDMVKNSSSTARKRSIKVVSDCIDEDLFRPVSVAPSLRSPLVLWVGKLDDHKNWKGFISIARIIQMNHRDAEFWMIGGEAANDEVVDHLLSRIADGGLMSSIRWVGRVEHDRMPALYSIAGKRRGCMLITSRGEAFCTAAVEAMLCGCPVVAPNHTALPEVVKDQVYGLLFDPGDDDDAAAKVNTMISNESLRAEVVRRGIEELPGKFGVSEVMRILADALTEE